MTKSPEEIAGDVWDEAQAQAQAFAAVQLAESGLTLGTDDERDIFSAGVAAGQTGMLLALRDRGMLRGPS